MCGRGCMAEGMMDEELGGPDRECVGMCMAAGMCEAMCADEHPDMPECPDVCMCVVSQAEDMCEQGDDQCM